MSVRKCSACGETTRGDVPFCSNCGALFPVHNESELMRQAVGYSIDWKWVILGAIVALGLQMGLLAGLWGVWGNRILVGEKGRSLLEVNLNGVSPDWGPNTGGSKVVLTIKPDNRGENTATKVMAVYFAGQKAEPFHVQFLRKFRKECTVHCRKQAKAQNLYVTCMQGCDKKELKATEEKLEAAIKPCEALFDKKSEMKPDKYKVEFQRLRCPAATKAFRAFTKRKERCEEECPKRKKQVDAEEARCKSCRKMLPVYEKRATACKADVSKCWAFMDHLGRVPLPKPPNFASIADPKKRAEAKKLYEKQLRDAKATNKVRAKRERKQIRTKVNAYTPKVPGKVGWSDVTLVFRSGERLVKKHGFYYDKPDASKRTRVKRPKHKRHDPVRTPGFWLLLVLSCIFYLLGGYLIGRYSPSIGTREALVSGLTAWVVFEVVLVVVGAATSAHLFSLLVGLFGFVGCAMVGALLGQRRTSFG